MNLKTALLHPTFVLRITLSVILIMHSVPGILAGTVVGFGEYLNQSGFAPVGLFLAWSVKLSHVIGGILLLLNLYIIPVSVIHITIFLMGIIMVHAQHGWYVAGNGTNGVEFNVLLISVCIYLILYKRIEDRKKD